MTLKEIRAMFQVGQKWHVVNTHVTKHTGPRTVVEKLSNQLIWSTPDAPRLWMTFPKASQVIEAREGFLSFRLFDAPAVADKTLTLTRED